jgi:hypothetical protein
MKVKVLQEWLGNCVGSVIDLKIEAANILCDREVVRTLTAEEIKEMNAAKNDVVQGDTPETISNENKKSGSVIKLQRRPPHDKMVRQPQTEK